MILKKLLLVLLISTFFISCEDYLEIQPLDEYADDAVWNNDPALIQSFVNNIYNGLGQTGVRVMMSTYAAATMLTFGWDAEAVTNSLITPTSYFRFNNTQDQSGFYVWENVYKQIRACNLFFQKIVDAAAVSDVEKVRLEGEVHFLRAYLYHMLVSVYGGVPIIDKAYQLGDDYFALRNSFEECIDFIVEDCDQAYIKLSDNMDKGRPSKGAALALKSRVLLFAASDLFNTGSTWATGYEHPELIGYVGGDREARWKKAKEAAKAVIDLNFYALHKEVPAESEDISKNYGEIFLLNETSEDIFVKFYSQNIVSGLGMPALNNGPNGWHLRGANTPIGQIVDEYEMADGSAFDWNNPEHAARPYEDREPRFYASIL